MVGASEWLNLVNLLGNVGFPIVIAGYLLFQFERRIQSLEGIIRELHSELVEKEELERKIDQYVRLLDGERQPKKR
ncbi:YvrJ family protein [Fictibacillus norfolkensis]|uniref:YvrJ family protein n=1 Tax=Fictibacillus norfolkensis TaxID=2762233 RepID=A0ABR8SSF8_9BACL|nr:YvrJ family protein [Fictibacillus norfolkensis]MBD7966330.1 YvrJ family protein [Fictibacillus norfolkensis]